MSIQPIRFTDEGHAATRELLRRYDAVVANGPLPPAGLRDELASLEALDREHGGAARFDRDDLAERVASIVTQLAAIGDPDLAIGVALWAQRHEVEVTAPEPVVNALAERSNNAAGKPELAAVFALMQGFIAQAAPRLAADLERSNPERAWRILHVNFAITAIRTEDLAMIGYAFDALDAALPDDRSGFYSEALAVALAPGIAPGVREAIAARHSKWAANLS